MSIKENGLWVNSTIEVMRTLFLTLFVQSKRDRAKNPRWISKGQNLVAYSSIGIYFGRAKVRGL
ncbi:MAG: hypothetical protein CMI15_09445 [Opitutaceae bacterium]|nr:hypothetical protein [Opitutaceae bacterium]